MKNIVNLNKSHLFQFVFTIVVVLIFLLSFFPKSSVAKTLDSNFKKDFAIAQNYFWLTTDEGIRSSVYFKTIKYLNMSFGDNKLIKQHNKDLYNLNKWKLENFKKEINNYYEASYHTMKGYFPLVKYISASFFLFPEKSRQHALLIPPDEAAVKSAVEDMVLNSKSNLKYQYHIFFNSNNYIWNEIAFKTVGETQKYYPHISEDVYLALGSEKLVKLFYGNHINNKIIDKLSNYVHRKEFFIVRVSRIPLEKDDVYVVAYKNKYDSNAGKILDESGVYFGYSIDERWTWPYIILTHIVFFIVVIILTVFYERRLSGKLTLKDFCLPVIGFTLGRVIPWIIAPSIEKIMPSTDLNFVYTLWWIALAGIAMIIVPVYGVQLIYKKFQEYVNLPTIAGKGGLVGISISSGVLSYLFLPFIFNYNPSISIGKSITIFLIFSVAVMLTGYIAGKSLDKNDKLEEYYVALTILVSAVLFAFYAHADLFDTLLVSLIIIAVLLTVVFLRMEKIYTKKISSKSVIKKDHEKNERNYYEFEYYKKIKNYLDKK